MRITAEDVLNAYKKTRRKIDPNERFVLRVLAEAHGEDDPWEWADNNGAEYTVGFLHGFMDEKARGVLPHDKRYELGMRDGIAVAREVFGNAPSPT